MGYVVPVGDLKNQAKAAWRILPGWIRAEVINDQLSILPRPTTYHAQATTNISTALTRIIYAGDLGTLCLGEVDVFLNNDANFVVPDILFITKGNMTTSVERKGIVGPPDLVFESFHQTIVSMTLL